jgi:hypothetical protein
LLPSGDIPVSLPAKTTTGFPARGKIQGKTPIAAVPRPELALQALGFISLEFQIPYLAEQRNLPADQGNNTAEQRIASELRKSAAGLPPDCEALNVDAMPARCARRT